MNGDRTPWIAGNVEIDAAALSNIEAHAVECYPNESCGFVAGPISDALFVDEAIREVNEADKFHALDPVTFPRTARTYFKINELRASRTFEAQEKSGRSVKVIYHSHCDAGAYFSAEDAYTFASEGQLMWPCAFLVVSVVDGKVSDRKLWVHVAGTNEFRESVIRVRD